MSACISSFSATTISLAYKMTCRIRQMVQRTDEQADKTRSVVSAQLVPVEFEASFTLLYVIQRTKKLYNKNFVVVTLDLYWRCE
jgi:hypothetical protein